MRFFLHENFVICKRNRLQTYLLTNLIINLMVLVDKENVKGYVQMDEKEHTKKEYASKGLAGTALGLGIGGLAVSLLNNGCNPLGIFGRNCGTNAGEVAIVANEQYLERKQCADFVELVNGMWQKAYDAQKARQDDRNILNTELFNIYSAMRNGFDTISAKHNEDAFNLYKYSRDSKDELSSEIGKLRTELAVLKATRPYQDALIQCDIRRVAEHADFNLWRRTCRMISGEVVLPNTPVIEGYASYNPCHIQSTTPAPAA